MSSRTNLADTSHGRGLSSFDIGERKCPGVRQQLRQATAAAHQALHEHPDFVRLLERRMSLPEYRTLLARLYGFHWPLERDLRVASPEILREFDARGRERSPALRADLGWLEMNDADIDSLPVCDELRAVRSNAELMGRLYVIEGSALGGRIMAAKLDRLPGLGGLEGRQFFTGRPTPDPLPWPTFCRLLETQGRDVDAVIEGAETTFRALAVWLTEAETHA